MPGMNTNRYIGRKRRGLLLTGIVAVNILVVGLLFVSLLQGYRLRIQQAETATINLSGNMQLYISEKLREIDLTLLTLKDELEGRLLAGRIDRNSVDRVFARHQQRVPESDSMRASDEMGIIRYGTGVPVSGPPISISDRDYFARLRDDPGPGMVFSKPVIGKISKKWVIIFARAYRYPDGRFAGVVYVPVTAEHFSGVFATIDAGNEGVITLLDRDGTVYARHPRIDGEALPRITSRLTAENIRRGVDMFSYTAISSLDGIERFFTMRKIPGRDLYIAAGLSTDHYMKPWRRDAFLLISLAILFSAMCIFFVFQIRSWWRILEDTQQSLEEALARVKSLNGLLPICASCKRIRDDNGYWNQIENYIMEHSEVDFSHSLCPDCARRLYPDLYDKKDT